MKGLVPGLPLLLLLLLPLLHGAARAAAEDGDRPRVQPLLEPRGNESRDHCRLPARVGPCRAAFPRFFYNVTSQTCDSFIFGGCENNTNNFQTVEECLAECSGVTGSVLPDDSAPASPAAPAAVKAPRGAPPPPAPTQSSQKNESSPDGRAELCEAEPEAGPCRAAFQRWFYDRSTGSCRTFVYGGCRGNKNNYPSEDSCVSSCAVQVLPSSKKLAVDQEDICSATPDPGPCRAAFPMYYYDGASATCQSFLYGGCQGNANRFGTEEECLSRCSSEGDFDRLDRKRSRWTAAVFLFATLTVISVLLLAALIFITLRRHRLPRRPSSFSDKEELLPEESSSLDSLSVPESPRPQAKA
ncbi:kunitz-type protease inhibitor 2 [Salarias fasciatus]|uniref:kunitz-type protease inhibitor 2 n=1 Tax=Salarias fasciatus TaxID=181472 RepID=UPI001176D486|nr:kunitz-type protease inhibitor 2-like [Salarias fasciatus]